MESDDFTEYYITRLQNAHDLVLPPTLTASTHFARLNCHLNEAQGISQILRNLFSKVGSGDKPYVLSVQLSSQLLSSVVTYICNTHDECTSTQK